LVVKVREGLLVITGCAHPGLKNIVNASSNFGKIYGILGGFHDFEEYDILKNVSFIAPCHCTKNKHKIEEIYGEKVEEVGGGWSRMWEE